MYLSDTEIFNAWQEGCIICDPFGDPTDTDWPTRLAGVSLDLRLDSALKIYRRMNRTWCDEWDLNSEDNFGRSNNYWLQPGESVLGCTIETVGTTEDSGLLCNLYGKSSLARNFIGVVDLAGQGDPGFARQWTLEIKNHGHAAFCLKYGMRIAQARFQTICGEVRYPYTTENGHNYAEQVGPTNGTLRTVYGTPNA